jgi:hypothetical protein
LLEENGGEKIKGKGEEGAVVVVETKEESKKWCEYGNQ